MPRLLFALLALTLFTAPVLAEDAPAPETPAPAAAPAGLDLEDVANPLAIVKTSMGDFIVELFEKETPKTIANFLDLAEGTKEFKDPVSGEMVKRNYFDNQVFHRVIDGFMIQGGSIDGTGSGSPGYRFENEINGKALGLEDMKAVTIKDGKMGVHPILRVQSQDDFSRIVVGALFRKLGIDGPVAAKERQAEIEAALPNLTVLDVYKNQGFKFLETGNSHAMTRGTLAMANAGPNTNGSQFYVNLKDNLYLNGKHTVFGRVVKGMDVVSKIGKVKTGPGDRPVEDVKILSIRRYAP